MPYTFLDHTADVRLKVSGATQAALFAECVAALMELLQPGAPQGPAVLRHVTVTASDPTSLLIDFLGLVLLGALTRRECYERVDFQMLTDRSLQAELHAVPVAGFGKDVKAVTYHEAEVKQDAAGAWETVIVLDI
jgi:SHS2 domain-containing protein